MYILWKGVLAPKTTPRPIIDKLTLGFKKMLGNKSSIARIKKLGDHFRYLGPDELAKFSRDEVEAHKELRKTFQK